MLQLYPFVLRDIIVPILTLKLLVQEATFVEKVLL